MLHTQRDRSKSLGKKIEEREETTLPLHAREQKLHDKYTSSYLQNISEPLVICFRNVVLNHKGQ